MQLVITKFIEGGARINPEDSPPTIRLKRHTEDDKVIVFWGEGQVGYATVSALKDLSLPFTVEIDPEDLYRDDYYKRSFGVDWNVNEGASIAILPTE